MNGPKVVDDLVVIRKDDLRLCLNPSKPDWFVGFEKAEATVRLMDGVRSLGEIVSILKREFDLPEEQLRKDAEELLAILDRKGMLACSECPPAPEAPDFKLQMAWIHVTHRCNLRCRYCYITGGEAMENELTTDEMLGLIDQFHAMGGENQTIALSGGEPLVREDFWKIVSHARGLGINLLLATNGMLVDAETARRIKDNFVSVQISLDGPRDKHDEMRGKGSYDGAVRGIENLVGAGLKPHISAVVTKSNAANLGHLVKLAHGYGLASVKSPPLLAIGKGKAEDGLVPSQAELVRSWWAMDRTRRELDSSLPLDNVKSATGPAIKRFGYGCGAGINSISVDSDGSIYPCQGAQFPEFFAGNIREDGLRHIWTEAKVFGEWRAATIDKISGCSGCEWRNYCGGGCHLHAYAAHGTICAPDRYCGIYKRMFEESIWTSTFLKLGRKYDADERWSKLAEDFERASNEGELR